MKRTKISTAGEQICPLSFIKDTPAQKRWHKRVARRSMRRNARLLDDAPKKSYYRGWST